MFVIEFSSYSCIVSSCVFMLSPDNCCHLKKFLAFYSVIAKLDILQGLGLSRVGVSKMTLRIVNNEKSNITPHGP